MKYQLLKQISKPIITRCGTIIGSLLAGAGIATGTVDTIIIGFTALAGVSIDLLTRRFINEK